MWMQGHVMERWVKVPAEELGESLTLGREGRPELPHHQKHARSGFGDSWPIYPPYLIGAPLLMCSPAFLSSSSACSSFSRIEQRSRWFLRERSGRTQSGHWEDLHPPPPTNHDEHCQQELDASGADGRKFPAPGVKESG